MSHVEHDEPTTGIDPLQELGKQLPWDRPDAQRREAVRSSLLVAARDTSPRRTGRALLVGAGFVAGALAAAAVALLVVRSSTPAAPAGARADSYARIESSSVAELEHTAVATATGTDEVVRVRTGTVRLAVPPVRSGDRVRTRTGDAEVEGTGEYQVVVAGDKLASVQVRRGSARVVVDGQAAVFLASGETWRASIQTAELGSAGATNGVDAKGTDVQGIDAKAGDAKAVDAKGTDVQGGDAKAVDVQGGDAKGVDARSVDAKAVDAKAVDAKAVDTKAIAAKAVDTKAIAAKAVETKAIATKAVDVKGTDTKGVDARPGFAAVDARAADTRRALDGRGVDARAVGGRAVDARTVDVRTVNGRAVDGRAADGRAVDARGVDGRAVDRSVVDGRGVDGRSVDGRTVDGSSARTADARTADARVRALAPSATPATPRDDASADGRTPAISSTAQPATPGAPLAAPRAGSPTEEHFRAGWALLRADKYVEAAAELARAAAGTGPLATDALYFRGVALTKAGRAKEAETALVAFLDRAPSSARRGRAAVMLGRLILARGDKASARAWFASALADPDASVASAARAAINATAR